VNAKVQKVDDGELRPLVRAFFHAFQLRDDFATLTAKAQD
jgi:hypothetical protein